MPKFFLILLTILFFISTSQAGVQQYGDDDYDYEEDNYNKKSDDKDEIADTTLYFNNLSVSQKNINAIKNAKDFAYVKTLDSLLKQEKEKKKKKKKEWEPKSDFLQNFFSNKILKIILWTAGIAFLLFILYRLFLADGLLKKTLAKSKPEELTIQEQGTDGNTNFDLLIAKALQNKNYRLAIRYNYLKSLNLLSKNELIQIAAEKTNYQYVREIRNYDYQNQFSGLTLHYEYIWYGEFDIDENLYKRIEDGFIKFNKNFN